jgi:hypothetical protein
MRARTFVVIAAGLVAAACHGRNGSPTAPSKQPSLQFSAAPNPVPYFGVATGCAGSTQSLDTWYYTFTITNVGDAPFAVSSFSGRITSPLLAGPIDVTYDAGTFVAAFGTSTIGAQGSVSSLLCVTGPYGSSTLTWTFTDTQSGGSFSAPTIQFLSMPASGGGASGGGGGGRSGGAGLLGAAAGIR